MPRMRIGVLTGGGDCPGLNAVIRGVVRAGVNRHGHEIVGFRSGWAGVLERTAVELTPKNTAGILHRGGTILGTSRTNPYKDDADGTGAVRASLEAEGVDALIPIGGEDTLGVAGRLSADGIPVVGVPKTIDNVCERIKRRHARGSTFSMVVVSEGAMPRDGRGIVTASTETDAFGHARLGGVRLGLGGRDQKPHGLEAAEAVP